MLLSDRLLVLWFRIVGVYLMEQDCFEDSLWFQVMNFLVKAETLYAKFAPSFFYPGHFGIALLQGVLSRAPLEWCIPRWLLEFCGWYVDSLVYSILRINNFI